MKRLTTYFVLLAFLISGCASTFKARFDHDPAQDFSAYKTFAWISEHPMKVDDVTGIPSPLLEGRIMASLEQALKAKGYEQLDTPDMADFVLSFTVGSRDQVKVDAYPSMSMGFSTGYPNHWRWGSTYYCCRPDVEVRHYTTGMLAIDVFDVAGHRPVWHGVATKAITERDRANIQETVDAAVASIMAGFPPD